MPKTNAASTRSRPRRPFSYRYRVRWSDVDAQSVVYYGRYLYLFDDAWTELFRWAGLNAEKLRQQGVFDCHVVHAEIDWRASAHIDDWLTVTGRATRWGNSSFDMTFTAMRKDTVLCEALFTYVSVDPVTLKTAPVPDIIKERFGPAPRNSK